MLNCHCPECREVIDAACVQCPECHATIHTASTNKGAYILGGLVVFWLGVIGAVGFEAQSQPPASASDFQILRQIANAYGR